MITIIKLKCIYFLLIYIILLSGCSTSTDKETDKIAITFNLPDVDSVIYRPEDFRGKLVLIHFWSDWCPHCRQEFTKLQKVSDELKSRGLEILAVNVGQSREHVLELKQEYRLTIPLLLDEKKQIAEKYGVTGLPTSFFIDKNGLIREKLIGWLTEKQIRSIFENMATEN